MHSTPNAVGTEGRRDEADMAAGADEVFLTHVQVTCTQRQSPSRIKDSLHSRIQHTSCLPDLGDVGRGVTSP